MTTREAIYSSTNGLGSDFDPKASYKLVPKSRAGDAKYSEWEVCAECDTEDDDRETMLLIKKGGKKRGSKAV